MAPSAYTSIAQGANQRGEDPSFTRLTAEFVVMTMILVATPQTEVFSTLVAVPTLAPIAPPSMVYNSLNTSKNISMEFVDNRGK